MNPIQKGTECPTDWWLNGCNHTQPTTPPRSINNITWTKANNFLTDWLFNWVMCNMQASKQALFPLPPTLVIGSTGPSVVDWERVRLFVCLYSVHTSDRWMLTPFPFAAQFTKLILFHSVLALFIELEHLKQRQVHWKNNGEVNWRSVWGKPPPIEYWTQTHTMKTMLQFNGAKQC